MYMCFMSKIELYMKLIILIIILRINDYECKSFLSCLNEVFILLDFVKDYFE